MCDTTYVKGGKTPWKYICAFTCKCIFKNAFLKFIDVTDTSLTIIVANSRELSATRDEGELGPFIYFRVNYTPSQHHTHSLSVAELGQFTVWVGGQNYTAASAHSLIYHLRNLFNRIIVSCFLEENVASKCISSEQAGAGSCLDWTSLHSKSAWDSLDTNYAGFPSPPLRWVPHKHQP